MRPIIIVVIVMVVAVAVAVWYMATRLIGPASVYIYISDKPMQVQHLYVVVSSIMLHNEVSGSWYTCSNASVSLDLTKLMSASQLVAKCNPPNGTYNLIFLQVSSARAVIDGQNYDCSVPSGLLKVPLEPQPIVINGTSYSINVDIGMVNNINLTGNGKCIIKPVAKAIVTKH
ncbi:DUF4382 domain-containing protein [Caldivirga sp. UBA161]|uniref:DUF4382 domain-containing protein n=1 Tax=Caldivirga sp. UBA161 TaxID=1915569 RepID=UPI0025C30469|nr:DUF4382 domain-containing protein [Caldivirga sp. UBA161]